MVRRCVENIDFFKRNSSFYHVRGYNQVSHRYSSGINSHYSGAATSGLFVVYAESFPEVIIIFQTHYAEVKGRPVVNFNHFPSILLMKVNNHSHNVVFLFKSLKILVGDFRGGVMFNVKKNEVVKNLVQQTLCLMLGALFIFDSIS